MDSKEQIIKILKAHATYKIGVMYETITDREFDSIAESLIKLLDLHYVTQQSELLKGFCTYLDKNDYYKDPYTGLKIHDFLKTL